MFASLVTLTVLMSPGQQEDSAATAYMAALERRSLAVEALAQEEIVAQSDAVDGAVAVIGHNNLYGLGTTWTNVTFYLVRPDPSDERTFHYQVRRAVGDPSGRTDLQWADSRSCPQLLWAISRLNDLADPDGDDSLQLRPGLPLPRSGDDDEDLWIVLDQGVSRLWIDLLEPSGGYRIDLTGWRASTAHDWWLETEASVEPCWDQTRAGW